MLQIVDIIVNHIFKEILIEILLIFDIVTSKIPTMHVATMGWKSLPTSPSSCCGCPFQTVDCPVDSDHIGQQRHNHCNSFLSQRVVRSGTEILTISKSKFIIICKNTITANKSIGGFPGKDQCLQHCCPMVQIWLIVIISFMVMCLLVDQLSSQSSSITSPSLDFATIFSFCLGLSDLPQLPHPQAPPQQGH